MQSGKEREKCEGSSWCSKGPEEPKKPSSLFHKSWEMKPDEKFHDPLPKAISHPLTYRRAMTAFPLTGELHGNHAQPHATNKKRIKLKFRFQRNDPRTISISRKTSEYECSNNTCRTERKMEQHMENVRSSNKNGDCRKGKLTRKVLTGVHVERIGSGANVVRTLKLQSPQYRALRSES